MMICARNKRILSISLYVFLLIMLSGCYNSPPLPREGIWKCDELNITLNFDEGEYILSTQDEEIMLYIIAEYHAPEFRLYVHPIKNDDSCSLPLDAEVFNGYNDGVKEDGCLYLRQNGTTYCFKRIG